MRLTGICKPRGKGRLSKFDRNGSQLALHQFTPSLTKSRLIAAWKGVPSMIHLKFNTVTALSCAS